MSPARPKATAREPRGARRKRETHEKLLAAAFQLIAERGVDAVTIQEITEAADVGFGSFYNHFASKEVIYDEVFRRVFEEFGDALDRLTSGLEEPAEVIAVCVRHTLLRAEAEPLWGRFLLRESLTPRGMTRGLSLRLRRDIERGVAQKRFILPDPLLALITAGGTVITSIALQAAAQATPAAAKPLALNTKHLPERTAAAVLRALGLPKAEASKIAKRRLPTLDPPSSTKLKSLVAL